MSHNTSPTVSHPEVDESAKATKVQLTKEHKSDVDGSEGKTIGIEDPDKFQVVLDSSEDPQSLSTLKKWVAVVVISSGSLCATSASSVVRVQVYDQVSRV